MSPARKQYAVPAIYVARLARSVEKRGIAAAAAHLGIATSAVRRVLKGNTVFAPTFAIVVTALEQEATT